MIQGVVRANFEGNPLGQAVFAVVLRESALAAPGQWLPGLAHVVADAFADDLSRLEEPAADLAGTVAAQLRDMCSRKLLRARGEARHPEHQMAFPYHLAVLLDNVDVATEVRVNLRAWLGTRGGPGGARAAHAGEGRSPLRRCDLAMLRDALGGAAVGAAPTVIAVGSPWPAALSHEPGGVPDRPGLPPRHAPRGRLPPRLRPLLAGGHAGRPRAGTRPALRARPGCAPRRHRAAVGAELTARERDLLRMAHAVGVASDATRERLGDFLAQWAAADFGPAWAELYPGRAFPAPYLADEEDPVALETLLAAGLPRGPPLGPPPSPQACSGVRLTWPAPCRCPGPPARSCSAAPVGPFEQFLRGALLCLPVAQELLTACLLLETQVRGRAALTEPPPADAECQKPRGKFRAGWGLTAGLYPAHCPATPAGPWAFASLGEVIARHDPRAPAGDWRHEVRQLRNHLAHGHNAGWDAVRLARRLATRSRG